jgi:hypothetical protein
VTAADFPTLTAPGVEPKIHSIFDFSEEALGQLRLWLEMHPPSIPINRILGFTNFQGRIDEVVAAANTTSGSYGDLTSSPGPTLTQLPAGKYLLLFGAKLSNSAAAAENYVSLSVNGAAAIDNDSAMFGSTGSTQASVARALLRDLPLDSNTVALKYRNVGGVTMTAARRWLIAIKVSDL